MYSDKITINTISDSDGWIKVKPKKKGKDWQNRQYTTGEGFNLPYNASLKIILEQIKLHHEHMTLGNRIEALIELSYCKNEKQTSSCEDIIKITATSLLVGIQNDPKIEAWDLQSFERLALLLRAFSEILKKESGPLMSYIVPLIDKKMVDRPESCSLAWIARGCSKIHIKDNETNEKIAELITKVCSRATIQFESKAIHHYIIILHALVCKNIYNETTSNFVKKVTNSLILDMRELIKDSCKVTLVPLLLWNLALLDQLPSQLLNNLLPHIDTNINSKQKMMLLQIRAYCNVIHHQDFTEIHWPEWLIASLNEHQNNLEKPKSSLMHLDVANYVERATGHPVNNEVQKDHCFIDMKCGSYCVEFQGNYHNKRKDALKYDYLDLAHNIKVLEIQQDEWLTLKDSPDKIRFIQELFANSSNKNLKSAILKSASNELRETERGLKNKAVLEIPTPERIKTDQREEIGQPLKKTSAKRTGFSQVTKSMKELVHGAINFLFRVIFDNYGG